jgi:hypothetical protein
VGCPDIAFLPDSDIHYIFYKLAFQQKYQPISHSMKTRSFKHPSVVFESKVIIRQEGIFILPLMQNLLDLLPYP